MVYQIFKRALDLVGASFLLIVLSPLLLVSAIAIKIDSKGPIFVEASNRVGKNGKIFRMYKFRTMIPNAHRQIKNNPKFKKIMGEWKKGSFKLDNDPRITTVGRVLRRFSVDEFPQFLNIIKGEMSLVGPRALYPEELTMQKKLHSDLAPQLEQVIKVKPGASGVWQVSGRSTIPFRKRVQIDAEYAKNPSLITDLVVLAKTVPAVLLGKGAQ
jgi:lipopolysaccharide/colanic/teichoic acid biosynthesis glycosyltransferase